MESADILTLIGRLVQILFGAIIVGFTFALISSVDDDYFSYFYYGDDYCRLFAAGMLGIDIILFGTLGLLALKSRPNSKRYIRLHLVVLILDILSVIFCITTSVLIWVTVGWYTLNDGFKIGPAICSILCAFTILPFIVRTLLAWYRRLNLAPTSDTGDQQFNSTSVAAMDHIKPANPQADLVTCTHPVQEIRNCA